MTLRVCLKCREWYSDFFFNFPSERHNFYTCLHCNILQLKIFRHYFPQSQNIREHLWGAAIFIGILKTPSQSLQCRSCFMQWLSIQRRGSAWMFALIIGLFAAEWINTFYRCNLLNRTLWTKNYYSIKIWYFIFLWLEDYWEIHFKHNISWGIHKIYPIIFSISKISKSHLDNFHGWVFLHLVHDYIKL